MIRGWSVIAGGAAVLGFSTVRHGEASVQGAPPALWPRDISTPAGTISIYEPQYDSLAGNLLRGRAATSITPPGSTDPVFGALWFDASVAVDEGRRTVTIRSLDVTRVKLPDQSDAQIVDFQAAVKRSAATWNLALPLDQVRSSLDATRTERASAQDYKSDPPKIIFSETPAALITFDGDPQLHPVENSTYQRVVNTPALIFQAKSGPAWLYNGRIWYQAPRPIGPWQPVAQVPGDVRSLVPPDTGAPADSGATPRIITATTPTELVVTDGPPKWVPLPGNELLYADNTESNIIKEIASQKYWVLLSGRWFTSVTMAGPWAFAPPTSVPVSFRKIPPESPVGSVLAQVPGTAVAEDAVVDASVPQAAAVQRSDAHLNVEYDGDPRFEPAGDNAGAVQYAMNTETPVLLVAGRYYAVENGIWFVSGTARGPWIVADIVPRAVYLIPPSSPVYCTRFVYIYRATPRFVYVGYLPGYMGTYRYYGTVIYGTGWYYRPWVSVHRYYPRPVTFGLHVVYDPFTGAWGMGLGYTAAFVNVQIGWSAARFGRPAYYGGWWGPGGYRPAYRPLPGYHPAFVPPRNVTIVNNVTINRTTINRTVVNNRAERPAPGREARPAPGRPAPGRPDAPRPEPARAEPAPAGERARVAQRENIYARPEVKKAVTTHNRPTGPAHPPAKPDERAEKRPERKNP